ncbi:MAG: ArsA family ATPase [Anaerolineales bacterium]|nr:MAG: ArsA family ATPase [Anaerolineales bacterium]
MNVTKRILLYTGKGGVWKTSVAAAVLRCAELGYCTLVLSTDTAHSLADSLDTTLGPEPVEVIPNRWGQEVDIYYSIQKHWAKLQEYLAALLVWRVMNALVQ